MSSSEYEFTDEDFYFLAEFVNRRTGIVLPLQKKSMMYSRLARRIRTLELNSFKDYCSLMASEKGVEETENLVNSITTNLTSFFREIHHFEHLKKMVPTLIEQYHDSKRFRLWSAGCSTGNEPYSISMILTDIFKGKPDWDVKILATDIDTEVLNKARMGEYEIDDIKTISEQYQEKYCKIISDSKFTLTQEIKKKIHFKQLNLLEAWPMKNQFQIIFCRNVVIYFDKPTQAKLFDRYADQLCDGGYLYIGHSENLNNITDRFKLIGKTLYQKIK